MALLRTGQANRRVGETNMNERSSRSHRWVGKGACCALCAEGACCACFGVSNVLQHSRTEVVIPGACPHAAPVLTCPDPLTSSSPLPLCPWPSPAPLACCSVFTCRLQSKTVDQYGTSHIRSSRLHMVDLAGALRCIAGGWWGWFSRVFCVQMACLGGQLDILALRTSRSCHAAAPCGLPAVCSSPAGSERQKASGAQGERLKEATAINKSLSALGTVIMSLVDQQHVRCFGLGLGGDSVFCWWDRPADVAFAGWLTLTAWRLRVNECGCRAGHATSPTATPASLTCCKTRWAATPRPAWCVRCLAGGLLLLLLLLLSVDAAAAGD